MTSRPLNVLFLCTGNTARSILAESILRKEGAGRFNAFSAGSQPKGVVNPFALKVLAAMDYPTDGFRSKSWDEFAVPGAPVMDFVFTVCDDAAGEACPIWPGQPMTAHWGIEDPAAVEGTDIEKERAFSTAARYMKNRIGAFLNLPLESVDKLVLERKLRMIGAREGASSLSLIPVEGNDAGLKSALEAARLPTNDLTEPGRHFFRLERIGLPIGYGGYELAGDHALLRSIAIAPAQQGKGLGTQASLLIADAARREGASDAWLLTETAVPFFEKLGFQQVDRALAPAEIRATRQAGELCPSSAALMRLPL